MKARLVIVHHRVAADDNSSFSLKSDTITVTATGEGGSPPGSGSTSHEASSAWAPGHDQHRYRRKPCPFT